MQPCAEQHTPIGRQKPDSVTGLEALGNARAADTSGAEAKEALCASIPCVCFSSLS